MMSPVSKRKKKKHKLYFTEQPKKIYKKNSAGKLQEFDTDLERDEFIYNGNFGKRIFEE